jgi:hypothetical protein
MMLSFLRGIMVFSLLMSFMMLSFLRGIMVLTLLRGVMMFNLLGCLFRGLFGGLLGGFLGGILSLFLLLIFFFSSEGGLGHSKTGSKQGEGLRLLGVCGVIFLLF